MERRERCRFSVVIPTYNRPRQLRDCLEAITRLDYPTECFEVIVVDDGSHTPLDGIVYLFRKELDPVLLRTQNGGPGSARNRGAAAARGEFLAFTDDDCQPRTDWLKKLDQCLRRTPDQLIGGRTVNRLSDNVYSATSQMIVDMVYAFYNRSRQSARFITSNNMALSAKRFAEVGGFDPTFRIASEDREFCDRWNRSGYTILYSPDILILHAHPLTFGSFCKQHFSYGRGAFQFRAKQNTEKRRCLDFHRDLVDLVQRHRLKHAGERRGFVLFLLAIWQLAYLSGYVREGCRTSPRPSPSTGGEGEERVGPSSLVVNCGCNWKAQGTRPPHGRCSG